MLFKWFKQRRRRQLTAQPFPADWLAILERNVAHYRWLSPAEQGRLRDDLRIFAAEKYWEGCGGLTITDEIRVTISAQACLLVLGLEHNYFDRVLSVLVYPQGFRDMDVTQGGGIHREGLALSGQAHYRGPVILAWSEVLADGRQPRHGRNLVFHEFAHQLDMLDGMINGTPPLGSAAEQLRWREVMTQEYERLRRDSATGRATLIDDYGTTNEAEFFAVATETFFDRPRELARLHPRLYELLRDYYRQDPASRVTS
jgi:Mlc titration factor MtfA (ptsG expression regulator)